MDVVDRLEKIIHKSKVKHRLIDRISYAADAGFYHLVPLAVVLPSNENEIISLFELCKQNSIPITFRTGGTSLSGQAITDGILVDLSRHWRKAEVLQEGKLIKLQPGVIGGMANAHLKKYAHKIGPDPSSINSAMIGGIISNNSSGMCCGVKYNAYHTLRHIRFILPNGMVFDTENQADYQKFEQRCADLSHGITQIRDEIRSNSDLYQKIKSKYLTKNTVGYSLNAFIDFDHSLDIFAHLLVGAEGTLAFIANVTLATIPDKTYKATALVYFNDIYAACSIIQALCDSGAEAVELMDRSSLKSIQNLDACPDIIKGLPNEVCALLIEYQAQTKDELEHHLLNFYKIPLKNITIGDMTFTTDAYTQAKLWKLRKGMFPSVGAMRQKSTTVILEDIAFPVKNLADATIELQKLFLKHHYYDAIIFGHAKDGNLHFVVSQTFKTEAEVNRYARFIDEVVALVVHKYQGTLKAEHGTGRNMAPFVETEWGADAYRIMQKLKNLADPHGILNPGVIINCDPKAHLKNLKKLPEIDAEVDKCIECGYCEAKCPSKDLTLTPRRRIVVRRELTKLKQNGDNKNYQQLLEQYRYDGLSTCAVDGLCATDCPVDINTGDLVKKLRCENHSELSNNIAMTIAKNFTVAEKTVFYFIKTLHTIGKVFSPTLLPTLTRALRSVAGSVPVWSKYITPGSPFVFDNEVKNALQTAVYFTTCICRMMGGNHENKPNLQNTFMQVASKANVRLLIPKSIHGACCGQAFSSKGFFKAYEYTVNNTVNMLYDYTRQGEYPVVIDLSSCTHSIKTCEKHLTPENLDKYKKLRIYDSVEFIYQYIVPNLEFKQKKLQVMLHPACSLTKMHTEKMFEKIAIMASQRATIPLSAGCCGMAGDRGFLFPELTQSATAMEASEVKEHACEGYYSSSKTCEIALSESTGKNYEHIVYLLAEVCNKKH